MGAIHNGALTNSKRPECFVQGIYPTHVKKGDSCYLYDVDGKKYIDYICALGSNLVGYANPQINEAIFKQLYNGTVFSLSSTLEVEAAEKLKELFPFIGKMRFLKTGSEAASAGVRIAMAHTGRLKVLSHAYHGWHDAFVSLTPPAIGVPKQPHIENLTSLDQIDESVACVIIEPIITDISRERIQYLIDLKEKCNKTGVLLIFDEIITGFRFPNYSFSNHSGISPDILLLGKAIGGGMPLSVVATKPGIGENAEWFVSSTFAGDTISLAAMMKLIELLKNNYKLQELWNYGQRFIDSFNSIAPDIIKIDGYPTRGVFVADLKNKALFFQESCKAGLLFGSSFFYNFQHMPLNEMVLSSCNDIINRIKNNQIQLEGELPKAAFAQKAREKQ
jgi:glutamate-1-semialdehyde aminotransferase